MKIQIFTKILKYPIMETEITKPVKLSDFPPHTENPFAVRAMEVIDEHTTRTRKYFSAEKVILDVVNTNTGEVEGVQNFTKYVEVDNEQFSKLFLGNIQNFFDLGKTTIKVFCYIQTKLKPNSDQFIFYLDECKEYTKLSSASVYKGLAELLKNEFIARGKKDIVYYINPMIFFNGDRVVFAKAIRKKKGIKEDENQLQIPFNQNAIGKI